MLQLLSTNPIFFVIIALTFVISLTIHEFAHALAADRLGDSTPRFTGRLTLNPLAHLDPIGTLMILIVRFGWGKPVMINPVNFKNPRRDGSIVAFAGPLFNILLAVVLAIVIKMVPIGVGLGSLLEIVMTFNLALAFFNLLPVYPLDGFNVMYGLLPVNLAWQWQETSRYGIIILLILIMTGSISGLIFPIVDFSLRLLGF